jgi:hypothetical protein
MDPDAMRIYNAVFVAVCHTDTGWTCDAPRPAGEADVTAVREVLTGLGYPDAVVRLQRAGDPTPDGSVVYAVRLPGDRCVVAFAAMGSGPDNTGVSGLLPNGECLAAQRVHPRVEQVPPVAGRSGDDTGRSSMV